MRGGGERGVGKGMRERRKECDISYSKLVVNEKKKILKLMKRIIRNSYKFVLTTHIHAWDV